VNDALNKLHRLNGQSDMPVQFYIAHKLAGGGDRCEPQNPFELLNASSRTTHTCANELASRASANMSVLLNLGNRMVTSVI
jgi:hypothetical protein